jgi:hypothetical protein
MPLANLLALALALMCPFAAAAEPVASTATMGVDGRLTISTPVGELCTISPAIADTAWSFASIGPKDGHLVVKLGAGLIGEVTVATGATGVDAAWRFTANGAVQYNCLAVSADFAVPTLAGGSWQADDVTGVFPAIMSEMHLYSGTVSRLRVATPDGRVLACSFPSPTPILIQDNRTWVPTFSLRIGRMAGSLAAQEVATVAMRLAMPGGLSASQDEPVTIVADEDWVVLQDEVDIVPGSALDLSGQGLTSGPCGAKGRIIATPEGHFACADEPDKPQRFYGVNLCFTANFLPHADCDRLLDRLVRLGYNTVRIHHYEFRLTAQDWQTGFDWSPEHVDQLDYLMAGCAKRGLWLTTDLYVSRPVSAAQIGLPGTDRRDDYKILVPVHQPAYADWQVFVRAFLDRVNPYTGRRVADEPALAWLSLINEDNVSNYWPDVLALPQWKQAWNAWLARRCPDRAALAILLGDLADDEDPAAGSVALAGDVHGETARSRACQVFGAETERAMVARMRTFLRDEIRCPALLTDTNGWTNHLADQIPRQDFDYVDDHFYVDHPRFIDADWQLPSRSGNANPVRAGAPGGCGNALVRLWGKPFTISEYNYSGPGRFRGVGGILTGALAGLQDWDAVWRFAYAHSDTSLFKPAPITYFDLASDPLNQAADRAAVMLFLRRDLTPAPHRVALVMRATELAAPRTGQATWAGPAWLAWITRVGCAVVDGQTQAPDDAIALPLGWEQPAPQGLAAYASDRAAVEARLRTAGIPVSNGAIRSETGELSIDPGKGTLRFDTPRTAGGYADPGNAIVAEHAGLRIDGIDVGATVFLTSLDGQPIRRSGRLLLTHLTDLQNSGVRYAEAARQTLLAWGGLPHLVRDGAATVHIALAEPVAYTVWALSTGGRRLEQVATSIAADGLTIPLRVRGPDGARMLYEIVRK